MKLSRCSLCGRPSILYKPLPKEERKKTKVKDWMVLAQGPKTNPKVKAWCHGRCLGLIADIDILFWELLEHVDPKDHKKLKAWGNDLLEDISRDFGKLIRGLVRGRNS